MKLIPQSAQDILKEFDLTKNEIAVYSCLVEYGLLTAKKVAVLSRVPRVRTYQTLDSLCGKGLIEKKVDSKIINFQAVHPEFLNSYIKNKVQKIEQSKYAFDTLFPLMVSQFNKGLHRPSVLFYEGIEGFRKIYDDILAENKPIYIIASSTKHPEYQKVIQEYKNKEEKVGIVRSAIVSRDNKEAKRILASVGARSNSNNDTNTAQHKIKKVLREDLDLPGQIILYADKVAITNFTGDVGHFVIENKSVNEMFRKIFAFMWKSYNKKLID